MVKIIGFDNEVPEFRKDIPLNDEYVLRYIGFERPNARFLPPNEFGIQHYQPGPFIAKYSLEKTQRFDTTARNEE